jgi:hypothetical protein
MTVVKVFPRVGVALCVKGRGRACVSVLGVLVVVVLGVLGGAQSAVAAETGPVWRILSVGNPTNFKPGDETGDDAIVVTAVNVGGASTGCTAEQVAAEPRPEFSPLRPCPAGSPVVAPVTISDVVPSGMTAVKVYGDNAYRDPLGQLAIALGNLASLGEDNGLPAGLACTMSPRTPSCTTGEPVAPGDTLVITIKVHVETKVQGSGEVNQAAVSGGGAVAASVSDPVTVSSTPAEYGVAKGGVLSALSSTQAGGHPNFTTEFFLNTILGANGGVESVAPPKDVNFELPAGLVGGTVGMARCTMAAVLLESDCARNTMVGVATVMVYEGEKPRLIVTAPVFNITPAPGEPAAFAIDALLFPVRIDTSVSAVGEYRVRVSTPDLTGGGSAYMASVTFWGVPSEHAGAGPDAAAKNLGATDFLESPSEAPESDFGGPGTEVITDGDGTFETVDEQPQALLRNPTQCSTPLAAELETDSWVDPGPTAPQAISSGTPSGCGLLPFEPSLSMLPDTLQAGAPAGYTLNLSVPQPLSSEPELPGTPDVKDVTTTLPAGVVLSPSAANGLSSCTSVREPATASHPERPEGEFGLKAGVPAECPSSSQVGVVHVKSPATDETLGGAVYLGAPECEPCGPADAAGGRMVRLFIQIEAQPEAAIEGANPILVKLEGRGEINQQTGQLTTTFTGLPQLPFSDFKLVFNGGERAALANPRSCGALATAMDLTPWSTPYTPDATISSPFDVKFGLGGGAGECGAAPQFNPSFTAGTATNQAGGFSPFTLSFGRGDTDDFLSGLQVTMPQGLLAMISSVSECGEPQAAQGTCPAASDIGEASSEVGPGGDPYLVTGGKVYLTGPYKGAPYGLSVVLPAKAGPFTLSGTSGNGTVVVRAAITINPQTGAVTATSDPFPAELDGIPLQVREINTTIGTSGAFSFNPTSCEKLAVNATLTSVSDLAAARSSSFQDTNCAALKFKPSFTVSTAGVTSKAAGAALTVKVTTKQGPGTPVGQQESNIHKVDVQLPVDIPSRLTTLQKACTERQFAANPAGCPEGSFVGFALARTPALPLPLEGPAILVSHGGAAFPDLVLVLQGNGVVVDLTGNTDIKKGITYSKFEAVPDAPISSFELKLPEGPHSVLSSYIPSGGYNFCSVPKTVAKHVTRRIHGKTRNVIEKVKTTGPITLTMPTTITAQDGAVMKQTTKIAVTGCATAAAARKAAAAKRATVARRAAQARRATAHATGRRGR